MYKAADRSSLVLVFAKLTYKDRKVCVFYFWFYFIERICTFVVCFMLLSFLFFACVLGLKFCLIFCSYFLNVFFFHFSFSLILF